MAFDKSKAQEAAEKYIQKSQFEKAIRELEKIIEVDPNDDRALLKLAHCQEEMGLIDNAVQSYLKVVAVYQNQGVYQKALAVLKQAQKKRPDDDIITMNMAELYNALGLPHEAMTQLEKCLEHVKNNRADYGQVLQTMVRVDSENISIRTRYAQFLLDEGDTEGAKRQYALALAQLYSKEQYVDYLQLSKLYFKIAPNDVDVIKSVAQIYIRTKRFEDAVSLIYSVPPSQITPELRECLITCYTQGKRNDKAVKELKALAHQYISMGKSEEIIEEVWARAQQLAPNDSEVLEALGEDIPPMLSDSALNVISPDRNVMPIPSISNAERMVAQIFNQAMEAYRQGNLEYARTLCHQIIDTNERHLPALQLLSQMYESRGDNVLLAQVERKLARAVFDNDPSEAVRHVLKAERATPKAWENFNLMLVFGLNPANYGMSAPETSHSSQSQPQISISPADAMGARQPVTNAYGGISNSGSQRSIPRPPAPPLPPAANKPAKPATPPPISPRHRAPTINAAISQDTLQAIVTPSQPQASDGSVQPAGAARRRVPTGVQPIQPGMGYPERQSGAYRRVPTGVQPSANPSAGSGLVNLSTSNANSSTSNKAIEQLNAVGAEDLDDAFDALFQAPAKPAFSAPSSPSISPLDGTVTRTRTASVAMARTSSSRLSSVGMASVAQNSAATSAMRAGVPQSAAPAAVPAGIPDSQRQRVTEAIQEIEFYISLALTDDAKSMLDALIREFGDIDIIHDEKVRLDAMG